MKLKLLAMAFTLFTACANAEVKREDYPSYKAYLEAVSASNAGHMDEMERRRETDCKGAPRPRVGETTRSLYCAGAESAGSSATEHSHYTYYTLGSSFYIVEYGRITYERHD